MVPPVFTGVLKHVSKGLKKRVDVRVCFNAEAPAVVKTRQDSPLLARNSGCFSGVSPPFFSPQKTRVFEAVQAERSTGIAPLKSSRCEPILSHVILCPGHGYDRLRQAEASGLPVAGEEPRGLVPSGFRFMPF
jgi:hypothetical protein